MIEIINLTKSFKFNLFSPAKIVLDDLSFVLNEGNITALIGSNGAGKTTLIKIIMSFIYPSKGLVNFSKKLGSNKKEIYKNIGFVPERPYFNSHLSGIEFLIYMAKLSGIKNDLILEQIKKYSHIMHMEDALQYPLKNYSKGMLQRLGLIAANLHEPKFLILDEPFSGLDPRGRDELKVFFKKLNNDGVSLFFSAHYLEDVEEIAEDVVFINSSKLSYFGRIDKLMENSHVKYLIKVKKKNNFSINNPVDVFGPYTEKEKNNQLEILMRENFVIESIEKEKNSLNKVFYNI